MGTTQPIRNRKELQKFSTYYQTVKPHPRNYALIILGLNTALRISDLLQLQWFDVYDFYTQRFREHLLILEQKRCKQKCNILIRIVAFLRCNFIMFIICKTMCSFFFSNQIFGLHFS